MDVNSYSCEIRLDDSVKLLKNGDKENTRERETGFGRQPRRVPKDKLQAQKPLKRFRVAVTIALTILTVTAFGALAAAGVAIYKMSMLNEDLRLELQEQFRLELQDLHHEFHTVYTHWGSQHCPNTNGTTTIYTGLMAGHHTKKIAESNSNDGGTNFQCLPTKDAEYMSNNSLWPAGVQGNKVIIYGAEYHYSYISDSDLHNIPCAVCLVNSGTVTRMIPARTSCPPSWRREYYGYLMAQDRDYSTYECVDVGMEIVPGTVKQESVSVPVLVHVEASCNGLPCPPYKKGKELTCVICSI